MIGSRFRFSNHSRRFSLLYVIGIRIKIPEYLEQPGNTFAILSKPLFTSSKVLLISRLAYKPAYNYQCCRYKNSKCPSTKFQLHPLPGGEFFFDRKRFFFLFRNDHLLRRQIHRILLRPHLRQQITEAVDSKLGLCVLAVGNVQPPKHYFPILITLQQCTDGSTVWR